MRNLKTLLLDNHYLSAKEQKQLLEQALTAHKEDAEQRDDILWIGFEV